MYLNRYTSAIMENGKITTKERLREVADENYGYITIADIEQLGVPTVEVRKLASRGKLEHVRRGVYKFPDLRPTERDDFAAALVNVGEDAYLVRDAVLAVHNLALRVPTKIRVGTTRRVRHKIPTFITVEQRAEQEKDLETFEGLRTTKVAKAILDCRGIVMNERLFQALDEATARGLVTRKEGVVVRRALRHKVKK